MKIFAAVLLAFILVLLVPIRVYINSEPEPTVSIKYFWVKKKLFPKAEKRAGGEKPSGKKKREKQKSEKKRALSYTLQELLRLLRHTSPVVRRLLRRTTLAKFQMRMIVVGRDAADTAIKFGKTNAQVFTVIALLEEYIRLKTERVEILPGFGVYKAELVYSGEIRLCPLAVLAAGAQLAFWGAYSLLPQALKAKTKTSKKYGEGVAARKEVKDGKETPLERGA